MARIVTTRPTLANQTTPGILPERHDRSRARSGVQVRRGALAVRVEHPAREAAELVGQLRRLLVVPRELLDRDRAVLDDLRERKQRALDGKGWNSPQQLAVGSEARELARRVEAGPRGLRRRSRPPRPTQTPAQASAERAPTDMNCSHWGTEPGADH
jgi:hypothetical protein